MKKILTSIILLIVCCNITAQTVDAFYEPDSVMKLNERDIWQPLQMAKIDTCGYFTVVNDKMLPATKHSKKKLKCIGLHFPKNGRFIKAIILSKEYDRPRDLKFDIIFLYETEKLIIPIDAQWLDDAMYGTTKDLLNEILKKTKITQGKTPTKKTNKLGKN